MHRFTRLFSHDTLRNKFNVIIVLIIAVLALSLVNFVVSMKITSGIRAYVGGEGLWSKGQKAAVNNLIRYSDSNKETHYAKFVHFLQVPLGDKQARLELDKPNPSRDRIREGFVQGGNNPGDIEDMIFLYRHFRSVSYMKKAIGIWAEGDSEIAKLASLGERIHALNLSPPDPRNPQAKTARDAEMAALLEQVYTTDVRLTVLENNFSATLGEGSRYISTVLTEVTIVSTVLLGLLVTIVAILIAKAIIRLDTAKTEFVSLASHQLRTPLTAINWYAEALLAKRPGRLTTQQQEHLAELYKGGRRMARLINDILNVSSLDLGTYGHASKVFELQKVLNTVIKDLQASVDEKRLTLTSVVAASAEKVNLDQTAVTAILQNLLSNSVKYTPPGGSITVTASVKRSHLLLHISDSGVGIPRAQQPQVFTKFFIGSNTKTMGPDHTGLGLYIVKAMVDKLKGKITFDSSENIGTSFYITLPLQGDRHDRKHHA